MTWASRLKDSFEFVRDATKQVITLASGLLAASITLFGTMVKDRVVTSNDLLRLRISWCFLVLSVLFGVIQLFLIIRVASPADKSGEANEAPTVYHSGIRLWSGLQLGAFVIGLALFAFFGIELIDNPVRIVDPSN